MERQRTPLTKTARIRRWLLAQQHIFYHTDAPAERTRLMLLQQSFAAFLGWSLSRAALLFSVTPLPVALLCATATALPATVVGLLFGLWQGAAHPHLTLLCATVGLLARLFYRLYRYPAGSEHAEARRNYRRALLDRIRRILCTIGKTPDESGKGENEQAEPQIRPLPVSLRTLAATIAGTVGSLVLCIRDQFSFYALFGACVFLLLTPVACALLCFSLDSSGDDTLSLRTVCGHAFLLISVCFCLRSVFLLIVSVAVVFLLTLSLELARKRGVLAAMLCTLLGGAVIDVTALPPLLLTVLLYSLLQPKWKRGALFPALIGGLACTLGGGAQLFRALAPSICCGILLSGVLLALAEHTTHATEAETVRYQHDATLAALTAERIRSERLSARLCAISGSFSGLGEVLMRMGNSPSLSQGAFTHGDEREHAEQFSKNCSIMAGLLKDVLATDAMHVSPDDERAMQLGQALRERGAQFRRVTCLVGHGRCYVRIHGCSPSHVGLSGEQMHRITERITGCTLRAPIYDEQSEEGGAYLLRPRPRLSMQCCYRSLAAGQPHAPYEQMLPTPENKKAPFCGDTVRLFTDGQDRFYALICDGMGTGEQAALTSGISVMLLERMLRAGVGMDTALTLLNQYLRTRCGEMTEVTSTVDLLSLDLFSGKARFIKSGAAQTLILRGGKLYGVSCRTFPLGILSGIDVQIIPFHLEEGDVILMMSDGVSDALLHDTGFSVALDGEDEGDAVQEATYAAVPRDEAWLWEIFQEISVADEAATLRVLDRILVNAREYGAIDDMTVVVLKVREG